MGKKIIVVDDDVTLTRALSLVLAHHGFDVITANDGKEALSSVASLQPDLVLLDVTLPDIDGWDIFRAIRQQSATPVIFLSGHDMTPEEIEARLGPGQSYRYLVKPVRNQMLLAVIREMLG